MPKKPKLGEGFEDSEPQEKRSRFKLGSGFEFSPGLGEEPLLDIEVKEKPKLGEGVRRRGDYPSKSSPGWELAKEWGADIALFGTSALLASPLAAMTGPAAPLTYPLIAGGLYEGGKAGARLLAGAPPEPSLTEELRGKELPLPAVTRPPLAMMESALFFGGGPEASYLVKKGLKPLATGVTKATQWDPLKKPAGWVWENIVVKPTHIPVPYTGKTVQELTQPAIERLRVKRPTVARTFEKVRVQQALSRGVLGRTVREAELLLPSEQIEFLRGIGAPETVTSPVVKNILWKTERGLGKVSELPYQETLMSNLGKLARKPLEAVESEVPPDIVKKLFETLERPLVAAGKFKPKEVQDILKEIIYNPRLTPEVQQFAKDLWNFSAQSVLDVAKASTAATKEFLISKLVKSPGVVSSVLKPGYVPSRYFPIKGSFVPRDVELELEAMRKVPQMALTMFNKWFMTPWKTNKIILRPAAHFRNLVGNLILNDLGGMSAFDPRNWKIYYNALSQVKNKGPVFQEWKRLTGDVGRWGREEMRELDSSLRYGATLPDRILNAYDTVAAPMRGMYSGEETWFKLAKYMFNKKQGMSRLEAAQDAMKWTFNYGEVTPFMAGVRQWALPFVTWQSKVLPLTIETAVKHPLRFGKWIALGMYLQGYALDQVGLTEGEWETIRGTMPEYLEKGLFLLMPWRDDKGQLKLLNLTWMVPGIGDISEIYQRGATDPFSLAIQHPLAGTFATLISKKKYSGAPLYYDWEHPGTKAAKALSFIWEMWSPALMPGNIDWRTLWNAIQENPEALTSEEALASQFGFRLTTVDPAQMRRRHEALRKIHETEISTSMRRELREAKTSEETSRIVEKYGELHLEERKD